MYQQYSFPVSEQPSWSPRFGEMLGATIHALGASEKFPKKKKKKKLKNSQGLDQKKGKMDSKFVGASNPTKTPKPYDANDI